MKLKLLKLVNFKILNIIKLLMQFEFNSKIK